MNKHMPPLHRLPEFLYRLATNVNWESEKECFQSIAKEIAWFYAFIEDFEKNGTFSPPLGSIQLQQ